MAIVRQEATSRRFEDAGDSADVALPRGDLGAELIPAGARLLKSFLD